MKLKKVRIKGYRSIIDTQEFDVSEDKIIFVGPNEAGKSALLQAIQYLNPPDETKQIDSLRDYPRAYYTDINTDKINPSTERVVEGEFSIDEFDRDFYLPNASENTTYALWRNLDNSEGHELRNYLNKPTYEDLKDDLADFTDLSGYHESTNLEELTANWEPSEIIEGKKAKYLIDWLEEAFDFLDKSDVEFSGYNDLKSKIEIGDRINRALEHLRKNVPVFVFYNNYYRVHPIIHLEQLANRINTGELNSELYDYGNKCLLNFLGFDAKELSEMGIPVELNSTDLTAFESYRKNKDRRQYMLNAAEVKLTKEIKQVWKPNQKKGEASKLRIRADGQYLKVTVEDDLGVEVELNQRSEGFQWLVSFFIVFFSEADGQNDNAILLLDEPGLSLHGLKQKEFRKTISRLAQKNQTFFTTHSPFLVGPDELDLVRVVEMKDRQEGTKVHTTITAKDFAALLPLQEALGYDLAQSLFTQKRNLVLEGLTDYWYLEGVSRLLRDSKDVDLNEKIALVPAASAGKVVYFATILHAQDFKVAALLDSDSKGDQAAQQDTLVHTLKNKRILRTKDFLVNKINKAEIEDLLRETLAQIVKTEFKIDIINEVNNQPNRPIISIFKEKIPKFSKYHLAKAFIRWSRDYTASDMTEHERQQWKHLIETVNSILK
ncbi:MAG: AAA family ATPase [Paracoccaceae bacterium]|nr:AAA family ATPase [Paracoccaceae bacterium]MDE2916071.1 AAA family ATPase [Paracoccaceae bacterium]